MSKSDPAFPSEEPDFRSPSGAKIWHPGLTIRDFFAAKAMQGLIADYMTGAAERDAVPELSQKALASFCYQVADALCKEREK